MLGAISVMLSTSEIVKGTLLFRSLNIEVGYCREVELDYPTAFSCLRLLASNTWSAS
jgi:hypothetical protein